MLQLSNWEEGRVGEFVDALPFPFDSIGVQANVTFVDSDAQLDLKDTSQIFAMEGLGDSQNLVVFYEKNRFQVRAALNNRKNFLQDFSNDRGEPVFVEDYMPLDLSGSFDLTDNITHLPRRSTSGTSGRESTAESTTISWLTRTRVRVKPSEYAPRCKALPNRHNGGRSVWLTPYS